jgi:hypothetical protein
MIPAVHSTGVFPRVSDEKTGYARKGIFLGVLNRETGSQILIPVLISPTLRGVASSPGTVQEK